MSSNSDILQTYDIPTNTWPGMNILHLHHYIQILLQECKVRHNEATVSTEELIRDLLNDCNVLHSVSDSSELDVTCASL